MVKTEAVDPKAPIKCIGPDICEIGRYGVGWYGIDSGIIALFSRETSLFLRLFISLSWFALG